MEEKDEDIGRAKVEEEAERRSPVSNIFYSKHK